VALLLTARADSSDRRSTELVRLVVRTVSPSYQTGGFDARSP
jgi:hypothetical protein